MKEKQYEVQRYEDYNDEIDLMELVAILVKEKMTIFITFLIVSIIALGVALYERNMKKKAVAIISLNLTEEKRKNIAFFPVNVMSKLYHKENIAEKYDITLDEFIKKFEIEGIIPTEIKNKREFLGKQGETLDYTPKSYILKLRVRDVEDSKEILNTYVSLFNKELKTRFESSYQAKQLDIKSLEDNELDYRMYLNFIENDSKIIKSIIEGKFKKNLEYVSYGFGYRDLKNKLENLYEEKIKELENYLEVINITRNDTVFRNVAKGRIEKLNDLLKEKEGIRKDYSEILRKLDFEKNTTIPKGTKISFEDKLKEKYYADVVNKQIEILNEIYNMKYEKKLLEAQLNNLRTGNKEEVAYIETLLNEIVLEYNEIVRRFNILEEKENSINYGEIAKNVVPPSIISDSKAKIILGAGLVLGIFMGIAVVFMKTFFKNLKKYMTVMVVFLLIGVNSYSKEILKLSFSHKEISKNQNPDKTPFNLDEILIENFIKEDLKVDISKEEIKVEPILIDKLYETAISELEKNPDYMYVPSEYKVTLNLKDKEQEKMVSEEIKEKFSEYYINYFLQHNSTLIDEKENLNNKNYNARLKTLDGILLTITEDIENRKAIEEKDSKKNEYTALLSDVKKVESMMERELESYIKSNHMTLDINKEKIILAGNKIRINRQLELINEKIKFYNEILVNYKMESQQAILSSEGDIVIKSESSVRSNQYFEVSRNVISLLEKRNQLIRELSEIISEESQLKQVNEKQNKIINKKFNIIEEEIRKIKNKLEKIELKNYRQENMGISITEYKETK